MNTTHNQNTGQESRPGSTHSQTGNGDSIKDEIKTKASGIAQDAKREGKAHVDEYLNVAAKKVDTIADSVKAAAAKLEEGDVGNWSTQISGMADSMSKFSDGLRDKSADEVLRDVNRLARENPAIFIGSAVAIGFGLTRLMRATAQPRPDRDRQQSLGTSGGYGSRGYGNDRDGAYTSSTITGSADPRLSGTAQRGGGSYTTGAIGTGAAAGSTGSYSTGGSGTGVGTGSTGSGLGGANSQAGQSGFAGSSDSQGNKRSGDNSPGNNDRSTSS